MGLRNLLRTTVGTVVDACTRNPELRARVKADPKAALAEEGMDLPFDEVKAVEDTPETTHIALTDPNAELSDEQMETVVGGTGMHPMWEAASGGGGTFSARTDPRIRDWHANLGRRT